MTPIILCGHTRRPEISHARVLLRDTVYGCIPVRDGAIEIGSARAGGLISEIEGEIGRSVGPISRRFL